MHWSANDVFRYTRDYSTFSGSDLLQDFEEIERESVFQENGTSHDFDIFIKSPILLLINIFP